MGYWLMETEPHDYSWSQLVEDGLATWEGVHNYQAARNMRAMIKDNPAFFYRSMQDPAVSASWRSRGRPTRTRVAAALRVPVPPQRPSGFGPRPH